MWIVLAKIQIQLARHIVFVCILLRSPSLFFGFKCHFFNIILPVTANSPERVSEMPPPIPQQNWGRGVVGGKSDHGGRGSYRSGMEATKRVA